MTAPNPEFEPLPDDAPVEACRARVADLEALPHLGPARRGELGRLRARVRASDADNARVATELAARAAAGDTGMFDRPPPAGPPPRTVGPDVLGGPTAVVASARSLVARLHGDGAVPDRAAETLDGLLTVADVEDRWRHAEMVSTLGSDAYARAFAAVMADPTHGHETLAGPERDALTRGRMLALGLGDTGSLAVPLTLDPSVILTSDGAISPVRRLARTATGVGKEYDLVTSAGVTVEWAAEGGEVADHTPTLGQPAVKAVRQQSFVKFSMELGQDWTALNAELGRLLTDASNAEDARVFVDGNGTTEPQGLVTGLTATASEVTTATAATLALEDLEAVQAAVPPRFRPRSVFLAALKGIQAARRFEVVTGVSAVSDSGGTMRLLGDPLHEVSDLDGSVATGAHVLLAGDLAAGYVVYDRLPTTVELVPHLFGANRRPTGERGLFMIRRVGAVVAVPEALRLLTVA